MRKAYNLTQDGMGRRLQGIYKVALDNSVSFIAGQQDSTYINGVGNHVTSAGYVDATGSNAFFNQPSGLAYVSDPANGDYLLVADRGNNRIRKVVVSTGVVTTYAGGGSSPQYTYDPVGPGTAQFSNPCGITLDSTGTNVYVADAYNQMIRKIVLATGQTSILAGQNSTGGYLNGGVDGARFNQPFGLTIASDGKVYVADYLNHAIRKITP